VDGVKIREALENLQTKVEGVVTTYDKPFTRDDHEAITANIPVFGEVKGARVVYAYEEDRKKGSDIRTKVAKPAAKQAAPAKK
jgi:branched-chain amino acid transport system substrate-binding protein